MKRMMTVLIVALAFTAMVAPAVSGDTIHLKNGLKLRAYIIEQTAEKVTFIRYGGKVSISMDQVKKIDKDHFGKIDEEEAKQMADEAGRRGERVGARKEQTGSTPVERAGLPAQSRTGRVKTGDDEQEQNKTATRAYWQKLKKDMERQIESKKTQLVRLEKERRGLARNFISTTEIREEIEKIQSELEELETEYRDLPDRARKEGIPPGWIR